jgi:putative flippase GtrA
MKNNIKIFAKFLVVGVINTLIGYGIIFLCLNILNLSYAVSTSVGTLAGAINSFFMNRSFTFQNEQSIFKTVLPFAIVTAACYIIAYYFAKQGVLFVLEDQNMFSQKMIDNIAILVGMCIYTLLNFFGQRLFVFKK